MDMRQITHDVMRQKLGSHNMGMMGMSAGGPVPTPVKDVRDQPTIQIGLPVPIQAPVLDVRQQPTFPPVVLGNANGGNVRPTLGLIPGKVDPTVADDTTITTPSGATINAKKGEYVLSTEVVDAMGGADKLDAMVLNIKKHLGLPAEVGSKTNDMPDSMGRMDKPGLPNRMMGGADGGDLYGRRTALDDVIDATGNAVVGGVQAIPIIGKALGNAYSTTLGNHSTNGSGAPTYVDDPYSAGVDTSKPVQRLGLPDTAPAAPVVTAPAMTSKQMIAATPLPNGFGLTQSKNAMPYDPTADNASRLAAQQANEAMYAKQVAQQDAAAAALYQQDNQERLVGLRSQADALYKPREMTGRDLFNMGFVGEAKMSNPSYRNALGEQAMFKNKQDVQAKELANINAQITSMTGQRHSDQSDQTARNGQQLGLQAHQIKDATDRRGQDIGLEGHKFVATENRLGREHAERLKREFEPNKTEAAQIKADADKQNRIMQSKAALLSKPEIAALPEAERQALLDQLMFDPETETWIPGTKGKDASGALWWKTPETVGLPGRRVPKVNPDKLALQHYTPAEIAAYKKSKGIV